jgi:hypothetical protein
MTREYWKDIVDKWQASGKSMAEFCRDENLSYWTFRDWKGRFLKPEKKTVPGLVKLNLKKEPKTSEIEVLVGPSRILVPQHFDESHLIRIVKTLRSIA